MRSMECSTFEALLTDFLDGILPSQEVTLAREHALRCRECRRLLDDVKSTIAECKYESVEPSSAFEELLTAIAATHAPLDCSAFQEIITEFLDGFVPAAVYHRFEEHASNCEECSGLLTDVVYAVASCHSVHTYEEYEIPENLVERLLSLGARPAHGLIRRLGTRITALASFLMPSRTQTASWSFGTASALAFSTIILLLFNFSEDRSFPGIYRQAQVKAAEIYSEGSGLYAQKDEVVAGLHRVSSGIGEIWSTLGGQTDTGEGKPMVDTAEPAQDQDKIENRTSNRLKNDDQLKEEQK